MSEPRPPRVGTRYDGIEEWHARRVRPPHLWTTLNFRHLAWGPGESTIAWDADEAYSFPSAGGPIVQGGMLTAMLDMAMANASWAAIDLDEAFLTADLRVEFLRSARVGTLRAHAWIVRRTRRVLFCAAELHSGESGGERLATSRCTQVLIPAESQHGRHDGSSSHES